MIKKHFPWSEWETPSPEFSQCPFWFWNDSLDEREIIRQIDGFQQRGIQAFVIHPRIGLPESLGWLSDGLFSYLRVALEEARRRKMWVILYDEGMYPSGSAGGLVVRRNAEFQVRGLVCEDSLPNGIDRPGPVPPIDPTRIVVARLRRRDGREITVYERKIDAVIRGLHYLGETGDSTGGHDAIQEQTPTAADLLNPEAVKCFIELVYDRYHKELGEFFGGTVKAIFTDEPNPLSRVQEHGVMPGTKDTLQWINAYLQYDFTPHLPALWFDDEPDAARWREDYETAIAARLDETYYIPLSRWCQEHGIALTGHPAEPTETGHLRHLQIPGQDIVWRQIVPASSSALEGPPPSMVFVPASSSALEGPPSTMAKAAASVKFHLRRDRNLNEFAGAYGEVLTFEELRWLASWLLIRGCDLLVPHAFYYSVRGPRRTERPPDVGPHSAWWDNGYKEWAVMTQRLCWLNAAFKPVCEVAVLGSTTRLPWRAAKTLFENQIDFHYVSPLDLADAEVTEGFLCVGPGRYSLVIVEEEFAHLSLPKGVSCLHWPDSGFPTMLQRVPRIVEWDFPVPSIRARHLVNQSTHLILLFNEGEELVERKIKLPVSGDAFLLDPGTGAVKPWDTTSPLMMQRHSFTVLMIAAE